jgi:serine/threonine protein kinase
MEQIFRRPQKRPRIVSHIIKGLSSGIYYLHKIRKLLHRRICPSNIVLRGLFPAIARYWRYWDCSKQPVPPEVTFYSAPENQEGSEGYHSDIWSLGLIFVELSVESLSSCISLCFWLFRVSLRYSEGPQHSRRNVKSTSSRKAPRSLSTSNNRRLWLELSNRVLRAVQVRGRVWECTLSFHDRQVLEDYESGRSSVHWTTELRPFLPWHHRTAKFHLKVTGLCCGFQGPSSGHSSYR